MPFEPCPNRAKTVGVGGLFLSQATSKLEPVPNAVIQITGAGSPHGSSSPGIPRPVVIRAVMSATSVDFPTFGLLMSPASLPRGSLPSHSQVMSSGSTSDRSRIW